MSKSHLAPTVHAQLPYQLYMDQIRPSGHRLHILFALRVVTPARGYHALGQALSCVHMLHEAPSPVALPATSVFNNPTKQWPLQLMTTLLNLPASTSLASARNFSVRVSNVD